VAWRIYDNAALSALQPGARAPRAPRPAVARRRVRPDRLDCPLMAPP